MKNMKKVMLGLAAAAVLCTAACGTEEGKDMENSSVEDSMKDDGIVGETGEALKDGAEDLGEDLKDGAKDMKDSIEREGDKARE